MPTVVLLGTLDTKGVEYAFLRDRLRERGVEVLVVDAGIHEPVGLEPDISRHEVARAGGADVDELAAGGDRGAAVTAMAAGAEQVVLRLHAEGKLAGILALGGSGGSSIATRAMRALPVGVPKLMVSTVASGDTRAYVGAVDVTMMYSVVDISGVNRVSARIMANAAGAIAGMVEATVPELEAKPLVGATMFGVTTPCVTRARERLEELGYEVLVFHATGAGGSRSKRSRAGVPRRRARHDDDGACGRARRRRLPGRPRPAGGGGRSRECRRSCRSERSTWSTSARGTRCRRSSRDGTSTCTTRP